MSEPAEIQTLDFDVPVEGTDRSIGIARSDQGSRIIEIAFANPGLGIHVWEGPRGDDIEGWRLRWNEFVAGDEEDLAYLDARYGNVCYMQRAAIPLVIAFSLQFRRAEDTRARIAWQVGPGGVPIARRR